MSTRPPTKSHPITSLILKLTGKDKIPPSHERDWAPDQQILPYAKFHPDQDTIDIFNIRNCSYQTVTNYTVAHYDKTYKLSELTSLDFVLEPFGHIGAAHLLVTFGFKNDTYLAISIEIRKRRNTKFSHYKVFTEPHELMYVIADESDVIKLRTNYRKDTVYLYPVETTVEHMQKLFIHLLTRANAIKEAPEFYNPITNNCTTHLVDYVHDVTDKNVYTDYRLFFTRFSDTLAKELGLIASDMTIKEARKRYRITEIAQQSDDSKNFSKQIRPHLYTAE
ncbi:MAG: DUF4105 domain-containing protein [Candidatus Paceibacterota bacterium]